MNNKPRRSLRGLLFALLLAVRTNAPAATFTWNGGSANNLWSTAANWGGTAPANDGTAALQFAGSTRLTPDMDAAYSILSLTFNAGASAFTLGSTGASTLTIQGGGITNSSTNTQTISNAITVGAAQTWSATSGNLAIGGNVANGGFLTTVAGANNTTLNGVISGTGGVTMNGAGTLTIGGTASNTFTGTFTVNSGTVLFNKTVNLDALAGALVIGDGVGTDTVRLLTGNQTNGAVLTINSSGLLDLNGFSTDCGTLTMTGGSITTGAGTLTLAGNVTGNANATAATISGNVALSANRTFTIADGAAAQDMIVSAVVSGAFTVTKSGNGTMVLSGANTYTGATTISAGVLNIQNATALGTTAAGTTVSAGAALQIQGGIAVGAEALTLNGSGIASDGALRNISGTNSWAGAVTLGSASTIASNAGTLTISGTVANGGFATTFDGAGNTTVSGVISGAGGIVKNGSGTLWLSVNNTFSGGATLNAGTVQVGTQDGIGQFPGGTVTINAATLEMLATFSTGRALTLGSASSTLMVDPTFIYTNNGIISGTGTLVKTGTGTILLLGANTYSGGTVINAGTVQINADARLGAVPGSATPGSITFGGGTLATTANFTLSSNRGMAFNSTGTIDVAAATTLTYGGIAAGTGGLTKTNTGTLTLSGANTFSGNTTISAGTLALGNNLALQNSALDTSGVGVMNATGFTTPTFGGLIGATNLASVITTGYTGITALTLNVASGVTDTYSGIIADGAAGMTVTKTGLGTQILSGANTYTGATTVSAGILNIQNATALGTTAAGTTVSSGAALQIQGGIAVGAEALTLNGGGIASDGALRNISGSNSFAGAVTLGSASTVYSDAGTLSLSGTISASTFLMTVDGPGNVTASNVISGSGGLTKNGAGTLTLSGANTYTGTNTISGGTVVINSAGSLGAIANATTIHAATLEAAATITTTRAFTLGNAASAIMVDPSQTFTVNTGIAGTGGLTKTGTGTLALGASNTFTGNTTVSAGTLAANADGALGSTAKVTINTGGTVLLGTTAGNNRIGNTTEIALAGGTFNTGGFSETVGKMTLSANSTLDLGAGASLLTFDGASSLGSATLSVLNWSGTQGSTGGTDQLLFTNSSFVGGTSSFQIQFNVGGTFYAANFRTINANTIEAIASITPVPEPATIFGASALVLAIAWRERRRVARRLQRHFCRRLETV